MEELQVLHQHVKSVTKKITFGDLLYKNISICPLITEGGGGDVLRAKTL